MIDFKLVAEATYENDYNDELLVDYFVKSHFDFRINHTVALFVAGDTAYGSTMDRNVPVGELSIYSGMEVKATDGKVGKLDELVLDPDSGEITHIQMLEGHLFGKKDVAIPVTDIDFADGTTVYLKIDKKTVHSLPAVKVKR